MKKENNLIKNLKTKAPITPYNKHYRRCKIEALFVIEDWQLNFNLGNTLKYINRAGRKEGELRIVALKKALFYLKRETELEEAKK